METVIAGPRQQSYVSRVAASVQRLSGSTELNRILAMLMSEGNPPLQATGLKMLALSESVSCPLRINAVIGLGLLVNSAENASRCLFEIAATKATKTLGDPDYNENVRSTAFFRYLEVAIRGALTPAELPNLLCGFSGVTPRRMPVNVASQMSYFIQTAKECFARPLEGGSTGSFYARVLKMSLSRDGSVVDSLLASGAQTGLMDTFITPFMSTARTAHDIAPVISALARGCAHANRLIETSKIEEFCASTALKLYQQRIPKYEQGVQKLMGELVWLLRPTYSNRLIEAAKLANDRATLHEITRSECIFTNRVLRDWEQTLRSVGETLSQLDYIDSLHTLARRARPFTIADPSQSIDALLADKLRSLCSQPDATQEVNSQVVSIADGLIDAVTDPTLLPEPLIQASLEVVQKLGDARSALRLFEMAKRCYGYRRACALNAISIIIQRLKAQPNSKEIVQPIIAKLRGSRQEPYYCRDTQIDNILRDCLRFPLIAKIVDRVLSAIHEV